MFSSFFLLKRSLSVERSCRESTPLELPGRGLGSPAALGAGRAPRGVATAHGPRGAVGAAAGDAAQQRGPAQGGAKAPGGAPRRKGT